MPESLGPPAVVDELRPYGAEAQRMITAGWVALALAVIVVATIVNLALFFAVGSPFGALNDAGNALIGVLSAVLALMLVSQAGGWPGVTASFIGAAFTVWGSWLVMSGATGFVLAGFVSTIGFGFVGLWLASVVWGSTADVWFGPMLTMARIAALTLIIGGLAATPGALMGIDSYEAMPGWLWTFAIGWIGVYVLYPIAMFGLGRSLTR